MMDMLKSFLTSKKGIATVAGIASWAVGRAGFDVPADELMPIVGMLGAYVLGQGVADAGKEKAKVTASLSDTFRTQPVRGRK